MPQIEAGHVAVFVNYVSLDLDTHDELARLFWKQLARVQPESYVADADDHLTFVSRDPELFSRVQAALKRQAD